MPQDQQDQDRLQYQQSRIRTDVQAVDATGPLTTSTIIECEGNADILMLNPGIGHARLVEEIARWSTPITQTTRTVATRQECQDWKQNLQYDIDAQRVVAIHLYETADLQHQYPIQQKT